LIALVDYDRPTRLTKNAENIVPVILCRRQLRAGNSRSSKTCMNNIEPGTNKNIALAVEK
jgi:hypothetical protein